MKRFARNTSLSIIFLILIIVRLIGDIHSNIVSSVNATSLFIAVYDLDYKIIKNLKHCRNKNTTTGLFAFIILLFIVFICAIFFEYITMSQLADDIITLLALGIALTTDFYAGLICYILNK